MNNPYSELACAVLNRAALDYVSTFDEDGKPLMDLHSLRVRWDILYFLESENGDIYFDLSGINKDALVKFIKEGKHTGKKKGGVSVR